MAKAWTPALVLVATASLLASALPALGHTWGTNQTTTKSITVNGAVITSKVVWRAGNNGGTSAAVVVHVVSMKITVSAFGASDRQTLYAMVLDRNYDVPTHHPVTIFRIKAYDTGTPPGCSGSCSFSKTREITFTDAVDDTADTVRVGTGIVTVEFHILHRFVTNSISADGPRSASDRAIAVIGYLPRGIEHGSSFIGSADVRPLGLVGRRKSFSDGVPLTRAVAELGARR